jgi:hypothetical protein
MLSFSSPEDDAIFIGLRNPRLHPKKGGENYIMFTSTLHWNERRI